MRRAFSRKCGVCARSKRRIKRAAAKPKPTPSVVERGSDLIRPNDFGFAGSRSGFEDAESRSLPQIETIDSIARVVEGTVATFQKNLGLLAPSRRYRGGTLRRRSSARDRGQSWM